MPTHKNSSLTPEGRRRLCLRVDAGRPISHVAAEAGISRKALSKWYGRWKEDGMDGLQDQSSRPQHSPTSTSDDVVDAIIELRRAEKWGATRIAAHLAERGIQVSPATVHRVLDRRGMSRVRDMDPPTGELARDDNRYEYDTPGGMVHVDIKKVGKIPTGGGWAVHGRGTDEHRASKRKGKGTGKVGVAYLHSVVDDHSRLAYTEVLDDEKGPTAAAFWFRAASFLGDHGISHIERCMTDNGSCYRSHVWAEALAATGTRHHRTKPYTPRTNGKVERYNQTMLKEWLRRRPYDSEADRTAALADFLNYYNHERKHSSLGYVAPITRAQQVGQKVAPQETEELCEITPDQTSIFEFLDLPL